MTVFDEAARVAGFHLDGTQRAAAERLNRLLTRPLAARPFRSPSTSGIYLWGPVGRGKTWLLDRFCEAVPARVGAARFHFHEFYRRLHTEVWARRGAPDAVARALEVLLGGARVLCFDELHLHDVGDTMLLTRALRVALDRRVTVAATSNYPPAGLLPDPLFHHLAEPLIGLLTERLDILRVGGSADYRETPGTANDAPTGFSSGSFVLEPDGPVAPGPAPEKASAVELRGGRTVTALHARDDHIWFDFGEICGAPISANDVIGLAARYTRWTVSGVAPFAAIHIDVQQRFVNLVDVLYDRDLPLTLTAALPLGDLLTVPDGRPASPDIARARSRLNRLRTIRVNYPADQE